MTDPAEIAVQATAQPVPAAPVVDPPSPVRSVRAEAAARRRQAAKATPAPRAARPRPVEEPAIAAAGVALSPLDPTPGPAVPEGKQHVHHVHFLADGVTALDRVFVRGEEVRVKEGTTWYEQAHDRDGNCIFALSDDEQVRRFGKVLWAEGGWPYDPYDLQARLDNGELLTAEEQTLLKAANEARFKHQPIGATRRR